MNKREAILDATLHLLSKKGFHGFSIRDVAKESGVAIGTVYLYFADRDDLIKQVYDQIVDKVVVYLSGSTETPATIEQQFNRLCHQFWALFVQQPEILLSKTQFDHLPPDVLRSHYQQAKSRTSPVSDFFAQGIQSGKLKNLPDEILFSLAFEPLFEIARKRLLGLIEMDDAILEHVIAASWAAIKK